MLEGGEGETMAYLFDDELRGAIEARLRAFPREGLHDGALKRAAVAITVVPHEGPHGPGAGFLLTRRAPKMNAHAGQWALPGGRLDEGEDALLVMSSDDESTYFDSIEAELESSFERITGEGLASLR